MKRKINKTISKGMTLPSRFIVKPGVNPIELNKSVVKIAIVNQIFLERFSDIASELHDWNKQVIQRAEKHERDIEHLQTLIYNEQFNQYEDILRRTEQTFERVVDILIESSMDDIHDVDCFLEIKRRNKAENTREYLDFLEQNVELINS